MEAEELQAIASGQRGKVVVHGLEARDALPLKNALTQAGTSVRVLEVIVRHCHAFHAVRSLAHSPEPTTVRRHLARRCLWIARLLGNQSAAAETRAQRTLAIALESLGLGDPIHSFSSRCRAMQAATTTESTPS